jgi:hypothetical protein
LLKKDTLSSSKSGEYTGEWLPLKYMLLWDRRFLLCFIFRHNKSAGCQQHTGAVRIYCDPLLYMEICNNVTIWLTLFNLGSSKILRRPLHLYLLRGIKLGVL